MDGLEVSTPPTLEDSASPSLHASSTQHLAGGVAVGVASKLPPAHPATYSATCVHEE